MHAARHSTSGPAPAHATCLAGLQPPTAAGWPARGLARARAGSGVGSSRQRARLLRTQATAAAWEQKMRPRQVLQWAGRAAPPCVLQARQLKGGQPPRTVRWQQVRARHMAAPPRPPPARAPDWIHWLHLRSSSHIVSYPTPSLPACTPAPLPRAPKPGARATPAPAPRRPESRLEDGAAPRRRHTRRGGRLGARAAACARHGSAAPGGASTPRRPRRAAPPNPHAPHALLPAHGDVRRARGSKGSRCSGARAAL